MQDVAGVRLVAGSFFAGLAGSLYTGPGDVSWRHSSSIRLGVFGALWGYFTAGSCSSLVLGSVSTNSGVFCAFWRCFKADCYSSSVLESVSTNSGDFDAFWGCFTAVPCSSSESSKPVSIDPGDFGAFWGILTAGLSPTVFSFCFSD